MRRLNAILLTSALVFTLVHIGYFAAEYVKKPQGAYLASGVLLLSAGQAFSVDSRLQFQDDGVHDFQQIGEWSRTAFRKLQSSLWGSLKVITESAHASAEPLTTQPVDNDLSFGHAYYMKKGTPFTLYRLPLPAENLCVYVRELSSLRCLSRERPKST